MNATVAGALTSEFGLGAGDLGLLTSVYYLTFAAAQIPIGILLDRYGPGRIQSAVMVAAALGAALFAVSDNFWLLLGGRALIGLGVAASLTAGLKALVLWFPRERVPLLNGLMIMLGALGALTATLPAEFLLVSVGWRALFELLAIASAGCALVIYLVVPDMPAAISGAGRPTTNGLKTVYADPRFWRLAPLSATCIGTAWALQGLWAAPWLSDVERSRPVGIAPPFADHGNRIEFGRASVGRRGRSVAPTWCRTAGAVGPCRHDVHRGSVGIDPAIAAPVVCPVDRRGGGRCWNCPQLRDPGRVFPHGIGG